MSKFDSLLRKYKDNHLSKSNKWVVNLSSKRLSTPQKTLLSRGMKFAPAPKKFDAPTVIAEVESALNHQKVDQDTANNIRAKIVGVLNKPNHVHNNLTPLEMKALKELRRDPSIVILPADKGRATIILNAKDYDNKILNIIGDRNTYKILKADPTPALQNRMNAILLSLKKQEKLSPNLYSLLHSSNGIIPQMYGLPKIHKPDVPLRPIVSFYSSPSYQLSKHLCRLLSPLVGNTPTHIRNSSEFSTFINTQHLGEEILVSFDVVSLFTKVPIDLAIYVARERLQEDNTLEDRTALSINDIIQLLEFCLKATYFSFRGQFYQQIFGTAMGSPVSVIVADMVMENIEQRALTSFSHPPIFWKRYVDDTCVALLPSMVGSFHQHLNSIEPSIQFTVEMESNGCLPFLDILITRDSDGSLSTAVYRKQTHTDQYLQFSSHHPSSHKLSVCRSLFSRALTHSSSLVQQVEEESLIFQALQKNGYPINFIRRCKRQSTLKTKPPNTSDQKTTRITIPYIQGQSESIKRILSPLGIETTFRPQNTLRKILSRPKDTLSITKKSGVVYQISCQDCEASYIGQTGRNLSQRITEHKRAVRKLDICSSAVSEHVCQTGHSINWDNPSILAHHPFLWQRIILESWHINNKCPSINREKGPLPGTYLTLRSNMHVKQPTHAIHAKMHNIKALHT